MTWAYNYLAASQGIFNDDRLLKDPDMVARDDNVAWATAFWFWRKNVKKLEGIANGEFGQSTRMINGDELILMFFIYFEKKVSQLVFY